MLRSTVDSLVTVSNRNILTLYNLQNSETRKMWGLVKVVEITPTEKKRHS